MDLEHGFRREPLSLSAAVCDEVGVAGVDIGGSDCVESQGPDSRAMLWSIIHRYRFSVACVRVVLVAIQWWT